MKSRFVVLFALLAGVLTAVPTVEQLAADPQLWPAEVTVTATTRGTVMKDGKPAGVMLVGAGKKLTVMGVATDGVTGKLGGATVKVPVEKTSLLQGGGAPAPASPAAAETAAVEPPPAQKPSVPAAEPATAMQRLFDGKLVRYAGGRLQNAEPGALAGVKYIGLYYSASWCGPCRQFTPGFVDAYRELKRKHPEFEVIFVSADHSAGDMLGYMREDKMPWPAVKYDRREQKMVDYSGPGIPCLVLVDAGGKVLADSYRGDDYLGPQHVLAETRRILARGD
ncbi:MAG: thioredoxin-like domain-containing protein [Verrucomicrobiota bacterium]